MFMTASVDVIDGKKLDMTFVTTDTPSSVMFDNIKTYLSMMLFGAFVGFLFVVQVVFSFPDGGFFGMIFFVLFRFLQYIFPVILIINLVVLFLFALFLFAIFTPVMQAVPNCFLAVKAISRGWIKFTTFATSFVSIYNCHIGISPNDVNHSPGCLQTSPENFVRAIISQKG